MGRNIVIEVACNGCESTLFATLLGEVIWVDPCETCLDTKEAEGYKEGETEGYLRGSENANWGK